MASSPRRSAVDTASPARNFTLGASDRVNALVRGVPAYLRRRRAIEDLEQRITAELARLEAEAVARFGDDARAVELAVRSGAPGALIARLDELIARHNRYYPCEANLPIDPRTGDLLERGRPWRPMPRASVEALWVRGERRAP